MIEVSDGVDLRADIVTEMLNLQREIVQLDMWAGIKDSEADAIRLKAYGKRMRLKELKNALGAAWQG